MNPKTTLPTNVPDGGKGQSARCSRVFFLDINCDNLKLDGTPPDGVLRYFSEQVTRIEVNSRVSVRKYGHDKSFCAQDSTPGLASWDGSLTTKVQCNDNPFTVHAGQYIWLSVFPMGWGHWNSNIAGYAMIEADPIICNLENGDPVEHNYTFSSKGWWKMPHGIHGTFDCCDCCGGSGGAPGGSASSGGAPGSRASNGASELIELSKFTHVPVTAYQWNGSTWLSVLDECRDGFTHGPAPTEPGSYAGQLSFIPCVVGD